MTLRFKKDLAVTLFCVAGILLLLTISSCNKRIGPSANSPLDDVAVDSISFMVIGDWGIRGTQAQKNVAMQMDNAAKKYKTQFIISTGDNFYPLGVKSTTDLHWKNSFEDIYNNEGHQVPWYPVLGNHDYGANPQAQIDYSSVSNRWKMPARYYTLNRKMKKGISAFFVFTDTSPFVTSYYGRGMADLRKQDTAAQLKWLNKALKKSDDTWKIVVGHHPIYSAGSHGNTKELIQQVKPLLLETRTDFYISGHEHNLQYHALPGERVHYLLSGGGGYLSAYPVKPGLNTLFAKSTPGFMVMVLYPAQANFYFYDHTGDLLYQKQVDK